MKLEKINIAIAFDQNYLNQFYVLLESIFSNNINLLIDFHLIINENVGVSEIKKIESYISSNNSKLYRYYANEQLISKFVIKGTWTPSVYYKIFFPILVPSSINKLLYIDTDTVVVNDLKELFEIELGKYPLAAVYDNYVKKQSLIGIEEEGKYFNSGVLLFNLPVWRQQNNSEKVIKYLETNPEKILFVDQCALNAVLIDNWFPLDYKYNLIYSYVPKDVSSKELEAFMVNKVIIHFTLQRPWMFLCENRLRVVYKKYFKKSPNTIGSYYVDFGVNKILKWLSIRLKDFYFDFKIFNVLWRKIKGI